MIAALFLFGLVFIQAMIGLSIHFAVETLNSSLGIASTRALHRSSKKLEEISLFLSYRILSKANTLQVDWSKSYRFPWANLPFAFGSRLAMLGYRRFRLAMTNHIADRFAIHRTLRVPCRVSFAATNRALQKEQN